MPHLSTAKTLLKTTVLGRWQPSMCRLGYRLSENRVICSIFLAIMIAVMGVRIVFDVSDMKFRFASNPALMELFAHLSDAFLNAPIISFWAAWRSTVLLGFGVILPLVVFITNWSNRPIAKILQPYFLLIGAQFATLTFAKAMIGQGALTFVGFLYSLLRFLQLIGLMNQSKERKSQSTRNYDQKVPPWFMAILRMETLVWLLNTAFLFIYICLVVIGLSKVGLNVRVGQ